MQRAEQARLAKEARQQALQHGDGAGQAATAHGAPAGAGGAAGNAGKGSVIVEDSQLPNPTAPPPGGQPLATQLPPEQVSMLLQVMPARRTSSACSVICLLCAAGSVFRGGLLKFRLGDAPLHIPKFPVSKTSCLGTPCMYGSACARAQEACCVSLRLRTPGAGGEGGRPCLAPVHALALHLIVQTAAERLGCCWRSPASPTVPWFAIAPSGGAAS